MVRKDGRAFCCHGCLTVYELLAENGLTRFYELGEKATVRGGDPDKAGQYKFLDEPSVREQLVEYADARLTRVTFRIPSIHCVACVWLLENLFLLKPGVGASQVHFPRKELSVSFETGLVQLSELVGLLAALGYEPELRLSDLAAQPRSARVRRTWLQLGVAGFAFGNTMLFSIAGYLGLDSASGPGFERLVGMISLVLAIPVLAFSALDYWRAAWTSLRRGMLHIDVPIAAGILALAAQSTYEVLAGRGPGYFDSLAGLLFFLLCGKVFQQKTFDRLAFDRDYLSFFPLSVKRRSEHGEETVAVSQLRVGDELIIRNGELLPADGRLMTGQALIDYSFVTGESEPVAKAAGDYLYAGGRQVGGAIHVHMSKPVSQGHLASLWNQEAFRKGKEETLDSLTNRYSRWFTRLVIGIAVATALFWAGTRPARALKSFTAVLIVACPCALALAAPFALGTAQRVLAWRKVFLKNGSVLERLAKADTMVFDKTGTLTAVLGDVTFEGAPLSPTEAEWLHALARHSTHPQAIRLAQAMETNRPLHPVQAFREVPGCGLAGRVNGHEIRLGSAAWAAGREVRPAVAQHGGVHVTIDDTYRGAFQLAGALRPDIERLFASLQAEYELALLSGDQDRERERFQRLLGPNALLRFNQSPLDKLAFVRQRQESGRTVVMVGDGLNDAGALQQSDVGIAVVENMSAFSPASDVILAAERVTQLDQVARFARSTVRVVRAGFVLSAIYNVVGISIAAQGLLAPVVCAVLMPLSSVTVVVFACGLTAWAGLRVLGPALSETGPGDRQRSGTANRDERQAESSAELSLSASVEAVL